MSNWSDVIEDIFCRKKKPADPLIKPISEKNECPLKNDTPKPRLTDAEISETRAEKRRQLRELNKEKKKEIQPFQIV